MSSKNICFHGEIRINISLIPPLICSHVNMCLLVFNPWPFHLAGEQHIHINPFYTE